MRFSPLMEIVLDRDKWRDKALRLAALLNEVDALDDGDERFCWKHADLFKRIHAAIEA